MAKSPYKLPNVFVGCPYGGRFKFATFKAALDRIPFKWFYADTSLATKQLLGILRSYITAAEFCIFDISLWNPNVALEIGLADGLDAEYYILLESWTLQRRASRHSRHPADRVHFCQRDEQGRSRSERRPVPRARAHSSPKYLG